MLFILSGASAVGKSFCVDFLCTRYNFRTIVPFTSRPPRITEAEGMHYHFRNREDLVALSQNLSTGYWGTLLNNQHVYGYMAELDDLVVQPHNYVIQASAELAIRVGEAHQLAREHKQLILGFLNFQSPGVLEQKLRERFDADEYDKRLIHAHQEIDRKNHFDFEVRANDPFAIAGYLVERLVHSYELELPHRLARPVYGAMSDVDILHSTEEPDGLRIHNIDQAQLATRVNGWSLDLTLGDRYWRVRSDALDFDLAAGSNEELERRFEKCRTTTEKGIVLAPNEVILSVTKEHIQLPKGIVGIFAGRTSYANVGLSVELSQIILQPGHDSPVRLQIKNNLPYAIKIYPGMTLISGCLLSACQPG
jgi:deoxycytidine triphosphate deaminase